VAVQLAASQEGLSSMSECSELGITNAIASYLSTNYRFQGTELVTGAPPLQLPIVQVT
jgi:hypothetical protein